MAEYRSLTFNDLFTIIMAQTGVIEEDLRIELGNQLGRGLVGVVYEALGNPNRVIKRVNLCSTNRPETDTCKFIKNDQIVFIQNIRGFEYVFLPSIAMENFVSFFMRNFIQNNLLIGVPIVESVYLDNSLPEKPFYIKMARYTPLTFIDDENWIANVLFKCMINLYLLQKYTRFTHYDLHWGNILSDVIDGKNKCVVLRNIKYSINELTSWPIIADFGDCIFSIKPNQRFINITTPEEYNDFNKYFDGLTMLKSIDLLTREMYKYPNLYNCFVKPGADFRIFFINDIYAYKPHVNIINENINILFTPMESIRLLFQNYNIIGVQEIDRLQLCNDFGLLQPDITIPANPAIPILEIDYPLNRIRAAAPIRNTNKKYYLNYAKNKVIDVGINIINPTTSRNIFSFSLFAPASNMVKPYKYILNPNFQINYQPNGGKSRDDAFYGHYLGNQIEQCIRLITNEGISVGTPGAGLDQWNDFGCLLIIDTNVLRMPMMIPNAEDNLYYLWEKNTTNFIIIPDRIVFSTAAYYSNNLFNFMQNNNIGSIGDYILFRINQLPLNIRQRFGFYEYIFPIYYEVQVEIDAGPMPQTYTVNTSIENIGSIVRFMPFQDNNFNVVLIRDAHSTMPNRNYTYDREWYETWINTDRKFFVYNGLFYNPPHALGLKTGFAAAWGARKIDNAENSILSLEQYTYYLGFTNIDQNMFYKKTNYGVDERILYRMYNDQGFIDSSYIVGITYIQYLIVGQENPRINYKIFRNEPSNTIPSYGQMENFKYNIGDVSNTIQYPVVLPNGDTKNEDYICKKLDFVMSTYPFYTDIRCVFLNSIEYISNNLHIDVNDITIGQYFDQLDNILLIDQNNPSLNADTKFIIKNMNMIPPRYHLWYYLFENIRDDVNQYRMVEYLRTSVNNIFGVNFTNFCVVNKTFWTGGTFNYDNIIKGQEALPIYQIPLPLYYPSPKNNILDIV